MPGPGKPNPLFAVTPPRKRNPLFDDPEDVEPEAEGLLTRIKEGAIGGAQAVGEGLLGTVEAIGRTAASMVGLDVKLPDGKGGVRTVDSGTLGGNLKDLVVAPVEGVKHARELTQQVREGEDVPTREIAKAYAGAGFGLLGPLELGARGVKSVRKAAKTLRDDPFDIDVEPVAAPKSNVRLGALEEPALRDLEGIEQLQLERQGEGARPTSKPNPLFAEPQLGGLPEQTVVPTDMIRPERQLAKPKTVLGPESPAEQAKKIDGAWDTVSVMREAVRQFGVDAVRAKVNENIQLEIARLKHLYGDQPLSPQVTADITASTAWDMLEQRMGELRARPNTSFQMLAREEPVPTAGTITPETGMLPPVDVLPDVQPGTAVRGMSHSRAPGILDEPLGREMTVPEQRVPSPTVNAAGETIPTFPDEVVSPGQPGPVMTPAGIAMPPAPPSGIGPFLRGVWNFVKRNVTQPDGFINKETWQRTQERAGNVTAHGQELVYNLRDLRRAASTLDWRYRFFMPEEIRAPLNAFLRGEADLATLPEPLHTPARAIRAHVDALSQQLIESGAAEGPLALTIERNQGSYLTRTYRIFEDPTWAKYVAKAPEMEAVRKRAFAWLRDQNPGASQMRLETLFNELLARGEDSPFGNIAGNKGLTKNLSLFKKRGAVPAEVRALWGEVTDPVASYARSVTRMASLLETHKFLGDIRDSGLGKIFFEELSRPPEAQTLIAAEGNSALAPLDGLYTTKDVAASLNRFTKQARPGFLALQWSRLNAAAKYSKVILSHVTQERNVLSNVAPATANGYIWHAPAAWKAMRAQLAQTVGIGDSPPMRDFVLKLQRLGVVGDGARASELRALLDQASSVGLDDITSSFMTRAFKATGRGFVEAYRMGDDVFKTLGWLVERGRLERAFPEWTKEKLDTEAAGVVRKVLPTYSEAPKAINLLRQNPLIGPFPTYAYEMWRTSVNTVGQTMAELADPKRRAIGAERLLGITTAAAATYALTSGSKYTSGVSNAQETAMREFLPEWSQNSMLHHMGKDANGKYHVVDLSYTNPYSYIVDPLIAAMRGEDAGEVALNAFIEAMKPFTSPELLAAKSVEALEIWKRMAPVDQGKAVELVASKVFEAFTPGSYEQLKRLGQSFDNPGKPYDPKYSTRDELLVNTTGVRIQTIDPVQQLQFAARDFSENVRTARRLATAPAYSRQPVDDETLLAARDQALAAEQRQFDALRTKVEAALMLGVLPTTIRQSLTAGGISRADASRLMRGGASTPANFNIQTDRSPMAPVYQQRERLLNQGR